MIERWSEEIKPGEEVPTGQGTHALPPKPGAQSAG
jgi:hypothetical protein